MQFNRFVDLLVRELHQFLTGTDAVQMTAFTSPDRNRGTPVSGTGNRPVLDLREPVAEALLADILRIPVDGIVVRDELILQLGHFDIPGRLRVVNQRGVASPAVRIVMLQFFFFVDFVAFREVFDDIDIQGRLP